MSSKPAPASTVPIPGTRRYHGAPCKNCGGTIRMLSNQLCFVCQNKRVNGAIKRRRIRDPIAARLSHRRSNLKRYNLTIEQYDHLLLVQNGGCAICRKTDSGIKGWVVDHCHKTGVTRGILCNSCNSGIGMFKDSPDLLRDAIEYLSGVTQQARMFFIREIDWLTKGDPK